MKLTAFCAAVLWAGPPLAAIWLWRDGGGIALAAWLLGWLGLTVLAVWIGRMLLGGLTDLRRFKDALGRLLQERLGSQARVGSVDKFQGQEADVVIISMCSSTLEESPRGADFLLDPNRINVAVSRARALTVVVASPSLLRARCQTIKEMELVNLFCWLVDYAERS